MFLKQFNSQKVILATFDFEGVMRSSVFLGGKERVKPYFASPSSDIQNSLITVHSSLLFHLYASRYIQLKTYNKRK